MRITNGLYLDPWASMATGLARHRLVSLSMLKSLPGEAEFKSAFVNCLTYADTMTLVGPITMLDVCGGDKETAHYWKMDGTLAAREWAESILGHIPETYRSLDSAQKIERLVASGFMSPFLGYWSGGIGSSQERSAMTMWEDFRVEEGASGGLAYTFRQWADDHLSGGYKQIHNGTVPVDRYSFYDISLGLLAVIFTYKHMSAYSKNNRKGKKDLIGMSHFPPTVFLIPAAFPKNCTFAPDRGRMNLLSHQMVLGQPSIYHVSFHDRASMLSSVPTVGLPFPMTSLSMTGKMTDPFRTMGSAFRDMMSPRAQYAAMALAQDDEGFNSFLNENGYAVGGKMTMAFDPIAGGRRVRNYNRGEFALSLEAMQIGPQMPSHVRGWAEEVWRGQLPTRFGGRFLVLHPSWLNIEGTEQSTMVAALSSYFFSLTGKGYGMGDIMVGGRGGGGVLEQFLDRKKLGGQVDPLRGVTTVSATVKEPGMPVSFGVVSPRGNPGMSVRDGAQIDNLVGSVKLATGMNLNELFSTNPDELVRRLAEAAEELQDSTLGVDASLFEKMFSGVDFL